MGVGRGMLWLFVLFVVAVAFWAAGGLLLYVRRRARRKVDLIRQTQTTDASEISAFSPGPSVEVKGTLRCDIPLHSEMAEESCACYLSRVAREYVRSSGPFSDGTPGSHRSRQISSETLSEVARAVTFFVEDAPRRVGGRCQESGGPLRALRQPGVHPRRHPGALRRGGQHARIPLNGERPAHRRAGLRPWRGSRGRRHRRRPRVGGRTGRGATPDEGRRVGLYPAVVPGQGAPVRHQPPL